MKAVEVHHLSKSYEKVRAVSSLSFEVEQGELFGIIGPDGAGKTTLFRMLSTLLLPDEGEAKVCGFDVVKDFVKVRDAIGYMPGRFSLYQDLTIEENLNFFATIYKTTVQKNYDLIADIYRQIEPFKKRRAGKLSGGMKQKLALCCALVHKPSVLFLDEPTTGVDPVSRKEFWEMLSRLRSLGISILVSTPYMDEAVLCDRIALIRDGSFLQVATPADVVAAFPDVLWTVRGMNMYCLLLDLRALDLVKTAYSFGETIHVTLKNNDIEALKRSLQEQGHTDVSITKEQPTVEDCFMLLSQKK